MRKCAKKLICLLILGAICILAGCGNKAQNTATETEVVAEEPQRLVVVQKTGGITPDFGIVEDTATGVQYLYADDTHALTLTPLLDADGNPYTVTAD